MIFYPDTIFEVNNWRWYYEGNNQDKDFDRFLAQVKLNSNQLETLRTLVKKINCGAISIHKDRSISLRFKDYHYHKYFIPRNKALILEKFSHFKGLEDGIYYGFDMSDLVCVKDIYYE